MMMETTKRPRYYALHQYLTGIILVCCVVTLVGSALAGARLMEVAWRGFAVFIGLYFVRRVIMSSWMGWQETIRSGTGGS